MPRRIEPVWRICEITVIAAERNMQRRKNALYGFSLKYSFVFSIIFIVLLLLSKNIFEKLYLKYINLKKSSVMVAASVALSRVSEKTFFEPWKNIIYLCVKIAGSYAGKAAVSLPSILFDMALPGGYEQMQITNSPSLQMIFPGLEKMNFLSFLVIYSGNLQFFKSSLLL